jgi:hypothetical protein
MRRNILGVACGSILLLVMAAGRPARGQDEAWSAYKGQIVFSEVLLAPEFGSEQAMVTALRRFASPAIEGRDGFWRLHLVAFLDPAPSAYVLHIVATDVTGPKNRHEVKVLEVSAEPGQRTLRMNDLVLSDAMGFEHGHRYELQVVSGDGDAAAGRAANARGKQDVYARGVVTLR